MELRANRIKHKLAKGEHAIVAGGMTHPDDIDAFGPNGFDGIWLEAEHGGVSAAELGNLTRACDIWGMTSVVRVNRNDQPLIYRTLDRGAQGIVVPHVNTRAEALNVVEGGKFAPIGKRGLFPSRQAHGVDDYFARANEETLLVVLIEDIVAIENLDEILEVDHIDVFFVAPGDLAASMGLIGRPTEPEVQQTIDDAIARIQAAGRVAGALCNASNVERYAEAGVRFMFTVVNEWIAAGAARFKHSAGRGASGAAGVSG